METPQSAIEQGDVPILNMLCHLCSADFPPSEAWTWMEQFRGNLDGITLRSSTIKQLKDSSKAGCHLCSILLEGVLPEKMIATIDNGSFDQTDYQLQIQPDSDGWILCMAMDLGVKDFLFKQIANVRGEIDTGQRIWTLNDANMITRTRMDALQTQYTTNINPLAIRQLRLWLKSCQDDHKECKKGATKISNCGKFFRLIDIGTDSNSNVRLVDSTEISEPLNYITLSYRWTAATKKTNLTWANKEQYYRSILISDWPPIFTDAISISRLLQNRYIWIDSLCIVQDQDKSLDLQDWDQQSVLMDHIYANGVLNLAGIEGTRSPGLSVSRNPLRTAPCVLTCKSTVSNSSLQYWLCWRNDETMTSVDKAPLSERGWTFQERILSKRTVHFGDQLYWECASVRASESFPVTSDHPNHFCDNFVQRLKVELQRPAEPALNQVRNQGLHGFWCSIVQSYSKTQLTKSSDRLVALRGIANSLIIRYSLSDSDYVAGIWRPCLPPQLLWAREEHHGCDKDEELLEHFPSWSWASCSGETRFITTLVSGFLDRWFIEIDSLQGSDDKAHTPNPTQVTIRGKLIYLNLKPNSSIWFQQLRTFSVDVRLGEDDNTKDGEIFVELDRPVPLSISTMAILPIYQPVGNCIMGLLLGFIGFDKKTAIYQRLGSVSCPSESLENVLSFSSVQNNGLSIEMEQIIRNSPPFKLV